ncbi:MAG: hypothetical protein XE07_0378 [Methanothrix harundinacea]|uniref:Uncharacterized protein n=1 Tax=Methanothrix harundinacea TaxID=301375 RepID=A0A101IM00_9EURY|nr:MAG: hypothetical protein XE07_0378 [Methanothrix harundinacea]
MCWLAFSANEGWESMRFLGRLNDKLKAPISKRCACEPSKIKKRVAHLDDERNSVYSLGVGQSRDIPCGIA